MSLRPPRSRRVHRPLKKKHPTANRWVKSPRLRHLSSTVWDRGEVRGGASHRDTECTFTMRRKRNQRAPGEWLTEGSTNPSKRGTNRRLQRSASREFDDPLPSRDKLPAQQRAARFYSPFLLLTHFIEKVCAKWETIFKYNCIRMSAAAKCDVFVTWIPSSLKGMFRTVEANTSVTLHVKVNRIRSITIPSAIIQINFKETMRNISWFPAS